MATIRPTPSVSRKFQFLVLFAFGCSMVLGALALYGLDKFYKTFYDYKTFAEKEKVVITLSKNLLVRDRLIASYFQSYDNAYIRAIEENHRRIILGFQNLSNVVLTTEQQELTQKNLDLYQGNTHTLEKLFVLHGELISLQRQKLTLEKYFVSMLQGVYMQAQDEVVRAHVETLMNSILEISYSTSLHLLTPSSEQNLEKEITKVTQGIQKFSLAHPYLLQQDAVFKNNVTYYMQLSEEFATVAKTYAEQHQLFKKNNLLQVDSWLVDLELAFYENQKEIYSKWSIKHSLTWHLAVVIGIFTLVALAWLMVALSQLFSLKK